VSGFPSPVNAGTASTFIVTAQDPFGNLTPNYTGTVSFSTSAASATFASASYTFTGSGVGKDNGVHTFTNGATLFTSGTKTLSATDSSIPATGSQIVLVKAGNAVAMTAGGYPAAVKAGVPGNFTVTLFDSWGNVASGFAGTVTLTSSNTQPVFPLPNPYTFT